MFFLKQTGPQIWIFCSNTLHIFGSALHNLDTNQSPTSSENIYIGLSFVRKIQSTRRADKPEEQPTSQTTTHTQKNNVSGKTFDWKTKSLIFGSTSWAVLRGESLPFMISQRVALQSHVLYYLVFKQQEAHRISNILSKLSFFFVFFLKSIKAGSLLLNCPLARTKLYKILF